MIKFFRTIRQQLLSEGNTSKYLKYAIGEIILVMIGILLALQVNNWNSDRKNQIEERELLEQLKIEFLNNEQQLLSKIDLRNKALASARELINLIDDTSNKAHNSKVDSLISFADPVFTFDPLYGIMNQLIESGKLSLIRNNSLRELFSNWNGTLADLKESEEAYSSFNRNDLRPWLYKNSNYRNIINDRIKNGVITETLIDKELEYTKEIGYTNNLTESSILLSSKEFENYLASMVSHTSYLNAQSIGVHNYITNVVQLIEAELNK